MNLAQRMLNPITVTSSTSGNTLNTTVSSVVLQLDLREDKPVEIINGKIEVTEDLIEEGEIYPVFYKNENFYVRKNNGAIEIFQIEE